VRDGRVVGFAGIKRMELRGRPVLNLFYRLDPAVWGGGIATEAAGAVVAWAADNRKGEFGPGAVEGVARRTPKGR
jgi:RimJ/RimL family protein N-acetyltransferase